jgi:NAD(P)-dependent dehydrogenase (short-subunit alcohol dehydrogenase family)
MAMPTSTAMPAGHGPELAVVVGATGAMGRVIVQALLARGLHVMAVARSADALAGLKAEVEAAARGHATGLAPGGTPGHAARPATPTAAGTAGAATALHLCPTDIADDRAIADIGAAVAALGRPVRIAVQGAGVATAGGVLEAPTAALVQAVDIKVGGLVRLVRAVEPALRRQSRIVAIGGHYGFEPSAYAATAGVANAALANLVRQYSWALGERGITAHLVAPGPADTERLHRVAAARGARDGQSTAEVLEAMRAESAIGAFTTPGQIAWAIALLCDPQADALAGGTLFMDAGRRKGLP